MRYTTVSIRYLFSFLIIMIVPSCEKTTCKGPCCYTPQSVKSDSEICYAKYEYQIEEGCGGATRRLLFRQYCTGFSGNCDGRSELGTWEDYITPNINETCNVDWLNELDCYCKDDCCPENEVCYLNDCCTPLPCGRRCGYNIHDGCGRYPTCTCPEPYYCASGFCWCPEITCGDNCCTDWERCADGQCKTADSLNWYHSFESGLIHSGPQVLASGPEDSIAVAGNCFECKLSESVVTDKKGFYLAKYTSTGQITWVQYIETLALHDTGPIEISMLSDNSLVIAGRYHNTIYFWDGQSLTTPPSYDSLYLARVSPVGELELVKRVTSWHYDSSNYNFLANFRYYSEDIVFIGGTFIESLFLATSDSYVEISTENRNMFLAKYNQQGHMIWVIKGQPSTNYSDQITLNSFEPSNDKSIIVTGSYKGTPTFGTQQLDILDNFYIAKYDPTGSLLWVKSAQIGDKYYNNIVALADGSIIIVGSFGKYAIFNRGEVDQVELNDLDYSDHYFLAKYSAEGEIQWARSILQSAYLSSITITAISDTEFAVVGTLGNRAAILSTKTNEKVAFGPSGQKRIFIAQYNTNGELRSGSARLLAISKDFYEYPKISYQPASNTVIIIFKYYDTTLLSDPIGDGISLPKPNKYDGVALLKVPLIAD